MAQLNDLLVLGNSNLLGSVNILGELVASIFKGDGSGLTNLNASNITTGTLAKERLATSGVTAGTKGATATASLTHDTTFKVPQVTVDKYGRVTAIAEYTMTAVGNTAGSTNTGELIYLVGATSQDAAPQTYSNSSVWVGDDGFVYAGSAETSGHSTRVATLGAANSFSGTNFFAATNSYNTTATQKFKVGNASSMWVLGGDGMQCFSGTDNPTTAKIAYLQYYGGGLQIGATGTLSNTSIYGDLTLYKNSDATAGGNLALPGNVYLRGSNTDNFVYYEHTGSETGYDWRAGYLGSGSSDANYYVIQSNGTSGTFTNAIRIGLTSLDTAFGGNIYPITDSGKSCGTSTNAWSTVIGRKLQAWDTTNNKEAARISCETIGTTSTQGEAYLVVGNATASSNAGNSRGSIYLYGTNTGYTRLIPASNTTSNRTLYLPADNGELVYHETDKAQGSTSQPVYINADGKALVITCLSVAYGGTGTTAWTAKRMVRVNDDGTALISAGHYIDDDYVAINSTDKPDYNLYVNGTTAFSGGHIYLTGSSASSSTSNATQLVFGASGSEHVVLSSNTKALVINPSTSSTANQIVMYLDQNSKIPSGIETKATSSMYSINPGANNTYNLGTSSLKWANVYATTANVSTVSATTVTASQGFKVTQTDGAAGYGLSLYGSATPQTYGIWFGKTATFGTYGDVTSDWATYFGMSNTANRGWVFRKDTSGGCVASISTGGNLTLAGYAKIGNAVSLTYVAATESLDFIFS